jgi:hypothetical protein
MWHRVLRGEELSGHVHRELPRPSLEIEILHRAGDHDGGVVVEDLEPSECRGGLGDHALDVGFVGHVGGDRHRPTARGLDLIDHARRLVAADVRDGDGSTLGREEAGCSGPLPVSGSGDQCDPTGETIHPQLSYQIYLLGW